jgi:hypothetical protein
MRSTSRFQPSTDPRVFYEPGIERLVPAVVGAVPAATERVESFFGRPFTVPVRIYVCATIDSYTRFTGNEKSGGQTTPANKIFISPKPENTPERVPAVVAHELTHLHVAQGLGLLQARRLPSWFSEGLATLVSGGGGAEGVSDGDAARAIVARQRLTPDESAGRTASSFGLSPHLFYAQGALFLRDLGERDPEAFRRFIAGVEGGTELGRSFKDAYGASIGARWDTFVARLSARSL